MALNTITIMGNLVKDPELRSTQSGIKVASLRVAVGRDFSKEKETDFFDVVAWRATADFVCRNFTKGQPILVNGSLRTRHWEDKEGNKRIAYEIHADNVYFAGGSRKADASDNGSALVEIDDSDGKLPWDDGDDDLPM